MQNKKKFTEVQRRQIRHWKNKIKELSLYKKLEVLDYAAQGITNAQISKLTGYTTRRISGLLTEYRQNGIDYFLKEQRKGGNRRNLTDEKKNLYLRNFEKKQKKVKW